MCRVIRDEIDIRASPKAIYDAFLDNRSHAAFAGGPARISKVEGGAFSVGGYISGYNLDLTSGKRIVQAWRGSDWPKGAFSIVSFEFRPRGRGSTRVVFEQRGIPDDVETGSTNEEWTEYYWEPLKRFFEEKPEPRSRSR